MALRAGLLIAIILEIKQEQTFNISGKIEDQKFNYEKSYTNLFFIGQ